MARMTHIRQCLFPCTMPLLNNQELMMMMCDKVDTEVTQALTRCRLMHIAKKLQAAHTRTKDEQTSCHSHQRYMQTALFGERYTFGFKVFELPTIHKTAATSGDAQLCFRTLSAGLLPCAKSMFKPTRETQVIALALTTFIAHIPGSSLHMRHKCLHGFRNFPSPRKARISLPRFKFNATEHHTH